MATTATVCGTSQVFATRSAVGIVPNHCTGLEARFNGEVGHAAAGMSRAKADEIVQKAVAAYDPVMAKKPLGKPFLEVYDPVTIKPTNEWLGIYNRVKGDASEWGLQFSKQERTVSLIIMSKPGLMPKIIFRRAGRG